MPRNWESQQEDAFSKAKELLISSQVLVHFDLKLDLILACDASSYEIGAVLAHRMTDGTEKPIVFVSRTLTESEQRYAQIEREGLACVLGWQSFMHICMVKLIINLLLLFSVLNCLRNYMMDTQAYHVAYHG